MAEMNKMAMLESGAGEKELKISTYRRTDFVILQLHQVITRIMTYKVLNNSYYNSLYSSTQG